jgi:FAD/FMN-containing dehydrogenase
MTEYNATLSPANAATLAAELQRSISGRVLMPGDPLYGEQTQIDNGRVQLQPFFVVLVDSPADVVTTLRFAQHHDLRLTCKTGGHSATGYCLNSGGIVIDFSLMKRMTLEGDTLRVQAGARWIDIYRFLQANGQGLIPIGGGCAPVGVTGFMLGGGYSFASRSYGLSIDNLISLTVVRADGEVRTVSAGSTSQDDIDLFWACRGGGGGNFGIVVQLHLQLQRPRTPTMLMTQIRYQTTHAHDVLGFYNDWVETLPDEMACYGLWGPFTDPTDASKTIPAFGFTCVFNGSAAEGVDLLQPLLKQDPMFVQMNKLTLPQFEEMVGRNTLVDGRYAYIRSGEVPPRGMTKDFVETVDTFMSMTLNPGTFLVWTHAGGKIDDVAKDATAFAHRGARFMPEIKSIWPRGAVDQTRPNVEWAHKFFEALRPHFSGAYVNYIDPLQGDWANMYYGSNYARLLEIKRSLDPDNFFNFQQSIGSTFEPSTSEPLDLAPLNRTFLE